MAGVAAYFDLDGTLLDASSEKTLTALVAKRRPWRIPWGTAMWTLGLVSNLLRFRSFYDAARNRGHLSLQLEILGQLFQGISRRKTRENDSNRSIGKT